MLETRQERVKLLKEGITGKAIEELYISYNNFKIVRTPVIACIEADTEANKKIAIIQEAKTTQLFREAAEQVLI